MARLYFLGNATRRQMFGCVVQSKSKTIVVDGGCEGDGLQLVNLLKKCSDSHVNGWFFTHPHHDHIGAFLEICRHYPEIKIDRIIFNFPDLCTLMKYGSRIEAEVKLWYEFEQVTASRFSDCSYSPKVGDTFEFDGMKVNVLRVFNKKINNNFINNSSTVYRIDSDKKRVLILGDIGIEAGNEIMETISAQDLYADYTQMAHHGQGGAGREFYQYIKPKACLWASPDWLWNNDKGNGYDTGPWATLETRQWMKELGVSKHIVEKDGTCEILI